VPYPIQSGSISDRLRKFFRIRGKTGFVLDEVVAPVVLVQDLTQGPYQAGVTPAAGSVSLITGSGVVGSAAALILNDKAGSVTAILGDQFNGRSFSVTFVEIQNTTASEALPDIALELFPRADVVAAGVPDFSSVLIDIQENDGTLKVPVEHFTYTTPTGLTIVSPIWRGSMGDNINTLGSRRVYEPEPKITIGPKDALVFISAITAVSQVLRINVRGFYQEQPN